MKPEVPVEEIPRADAIAYYRTLHKMPEASCSEYKTSQYIAQVLTAQGYHPQSIGKTGVYADLLADPGFDWLLLRADMDALPITEESGLPFSSEHPGLMHACGHDSHCAMLLEAAGRLKAQKLSHNIRFLFQAAEENTYGAAEAIDCGVIPERLCACFAMHVWPGIPQGTVATSPGALMASSDVYRIRVRGRSAHCAQSYKGADALQTAVFIASRLPEIRKTASNERTVLFCGSIHSGNSHNIVPDEARLWGTLRTFSESDRVALKERLELCAREAGELYGTEAEVVWDGGCPAISNSPEIIDLLGNMLESFDGQVEATLAAEDFACYQKFAPGVMLWLGTGDTPPLHNCGFYVPECILSVGVDTWIAIATRNWKDAL